ncbi:MAG: RrF2 family transcriptional regulator [Planctomycetota bacterium]|jgi:Rrf2 family protein
MDVLRKNTDYALRMMVILANHYNGQLMSARKLTSEGNFSYQHGCKLLQKLHKAKLVESHMGPKGGFALSREPSKITLIEIINVFQGGIRLNKCLAGGEGCEFEKVCEVNTKLSCLQLYIDGYLGGITLKEILQSQGKTKVKKR